MSRKRKRKVPARVRAKISRALKNYWRTVRAVRKKTRTSTAQARTLIRLKFKRIKAHGKRPTWKAILRSVRRKKKAETKPVAGKWSVIWEGRAFAFLLKNVYGEEIDRILQTPPKGRYKATLEVYADELIETYFIDWETAADSTETWWTDYHRAIRNGAPEDKDEDEDEDEDEGKGIKATSDRLKKRYRTDFVSVEVVKIEKMSK